MPRDLVLVGRLGAPHGVRGEIRLESFMEDPEAILRSGPILDESGQRRFDARLVRRMPDGRFIVSIVGLATREQAAALTNASLFLERSRLPTPAPDEYYWADLIGMRVETTAGATLGTVAAVHDYGAGAFLEIRGPSGEETFLPFSRRVVGAVELDEGRLIVDPPSETDGSPT